MDFLRVIVTGGRDFNDAKFVLTVLREYLSQFYGERTVVMASGCARNVDTFAEHFAYSTGIDFVPFPAKWEEYGPAAGPIRNEEMLREFKPHVVLAFPGGTGTAHMKEISRRAGVPVREFDPNSKGLDV
ncbi:putative GTP-binding protein [Rhizobium phage RHph_Y68]|uniref:Putative GTP-binding protein n=1 Tax=Rhizobium phage RHph_Y68 TaxID=2509787 RepID=A0A7S5URT5_9CAUD|nr:GTP-binding domain [Rhizobium phage RHph_Y68]QIG68190.1 putative GTP-binding protein [Rhizobium phage RHph_Y68]